MSPRYNYGDEDNRPDFAPPAVYAATVGWSEDRLSSTNGDEQIGIRLDFDDNMGNAFDNLTFSKKAGWRIDTFLKATGHAPKKDDEVELNAEKVKGWRCFVDVGIEDDRKIQGKKRNVILKYVTDKGVPESKKENLPF
jgi:hypothetical protein